MSKKISVILKSWAFPGEFPTRNIAGNVKRFPNRKKTLNIPRGYTPV